MDAQAYSQKTYAELRADARTQLSGQWGTAVITYLIYAIIMQIAGSVGFGVLIVGGPLSLGLVTFFLRLKREGKATIENLFDGFKTFEQSLILYLLIALFTFLWSLLFVIPGIIAAFRYAMAYYILHDHPNLSAMEAIDASKQLMRGQKMRLFGLYLTFIGWFLLSLFTFGIGFLWLSPYVRAAVTNFYENLPSIEPAFESNEATQELPA